MQGLPREGPLGVIGRGEISASQVGPCMAMKLTNKWKINGYERSSRVEEGRGGELGAKCSADSAAICPKAVRTQAAHAGQVLPIFDQFFGLEAIFEVRARSGNQKTRPRTGQFAPLKTRGQ